MDDTFSSFNSLCADNFLTYLREAAGYSEKTVVSYAHDIGRLLDWCDRCHLSLADFANGDAKEFAQSLYDENLAPASINRILSACRSFFRSLCEDGKVKAQPFVRVGRAKQGRRIPTVLTKDEVDRLLDFPVTDYDTLLETTMFNVFYSTGCRLSEVMAMKVSDLDFKNHRIPVMGKGSKERFVFMTPKCEQKLRDYLPQRALMLATKKCEDNGFLLVNRKGNLLPFSTVHIIFEKYRDRLGLTKNFTPHVFRHTFATHLLDNNLDIRLVQELLGHESIGTTQLYTHVSAAHLDEVYRDSHPHGREEK